MVPDHRFCPEHGQQEVTYIGDGGVVKRLACGANPTRDFAHTRIWSFNEAVEHECDDDSCRVYEIVLVLGEAPCDSCGYDCARLVSDIYCPSSGSQEDRADE